MKRDRSQGREHWILDEEERGRFMSSPKWRDELARSARDLAAAEGLGVVIVVAFDHVLEIDPPEPKP